MLPLTNIPPGLFFKILYTALQMEVSGKERGEGEWERGGGGGGKEERRELRGGRERNLHTLHT